jgi:hypothetical protein
LQKISELPTFLDPVKRAKLEKRFWKKAFTDSKTGCHNWKHASTHGYGQIGIDGLPRRAPRVAWELKIGPIPDGMLVCHTCDNPACINVEHLFLGTNKDNGIDKIKKCRQSRGETSGLARLTNRQVVEIICNNGILTQVKMARVYGVAKQTINVICLGKTRRINPLSEQMDTERKNINETD